MTIDPEAFRLKDEIVESNYGKETDKRKGNRGGVMGVGEQIAWLCGTIRV
jgi:hypothetical protein